MDASVSPTLVPTTADFLASGTFRSDDHEMLRDGLVLYDAFYLWAKEGLQETHTWNPDLYR